MGEFSFNKRRQGTLLTVALLLLALELKEDEACRCSQELREFQYDPES